jgi:hypothetical protein
MAIDAVDDVRVQKMKSKTQKYVSIESKGRRLDSKLSSCTRSKSICQEIHNKAASEEAPKLKRFSHCVIWFLLKSTRLVEGSQLQRHLLRSRPSKPIQPHLLPIAQRYKDVLENLELSRQGKIKKSFLTLSSISPRDPDRLYFKEGGYCPQ